MQIQELETVKQTKQAIRLVDGKFTASEAAHVVNSLLNEKINFHKLKRLSLLEGNCNDTTAYDNGRIEELENEKIVAQEFIANMRELGLKLEIKGTLEITVAQQ